MEQLEKINSNQYRKYYIISQDNKKIDVYLIEIQNINTEYKYLMIICKKEEVERLEKLKIKSYNDTSLEYELELRRKGRKVNEIKSITFISIFSYESINNESFIDTEKLITYKEYFNELIDREKKERFINKISKITFIVLAVLFIFAIFVIIIFIINFNFYIRYLNRERETKEEEDDILLNEFNIIRDNKFRIKNAKIGNFI